MSETHFIETEALLIVLRDVDADSGVYEVDAYLEREFLPGELRTLEAAADVLAWRARVIRHRRRAEAGGDV